MRRGRYRRTVQLDIPAHQRPLGPLTIVGLIMVGIASVGLIVLTLALRPESIAVSDGPPPELGRAATLQAAGITPTPSPPVLFPQPPQAPPPGWITPTSGGIPAGQITPTAGTAADYSLRGAQEVMYWLSIPAIGVEAPVIAREPELDGPYLRLPVPRAYAVAWDSTSAPPGRRGNSILTGHHNVYGRVFGRLSELTYGSEVALWTELGVFSYYVSHIEIFEERNQPYSVRAEHATWLEPTEDTRVTLITCWPMETNSHRLVVVATMR